METRRFNVLLDDLPAEWEGFPIDADFRTGIQIVQLMDDPEFSETERFSYASELLFPERMPDSVEECIKALVWFLSAWNMDGKAGDRQDDIIVMDYDIDQWRIYSAFRRQYGIDLDRADLHFWVFMGLLQNLEECQFTRVMDIRTTKIDGKMPAKQKEALKKAKKIYGIKKESPEDEVISPAREEFLKYAGVIK